MRFLKHGPARSALWQAPISQARSAKIACGSSSSIMSAMCIRFQPIVAVYPDTRGLHLVGMRATAWTEVPLPLGIPAFVQKHLASAAGKLRDRCAIL
eukprot:2595498-Amphidinium_carterae.1